MRLLKRLLLMGMICWIAWIPPAFATSATSLEDKFRVDTLGVTSVDFGQISIADLGNVSDSGSIDKQFDSAAGIPLSRHWKTGDPLASVLRLSDVPDLSPQQFSLEQIIEITGQPSLNSLRIADYKLLQQQSIADLVKAIPYLGNFAIKDVKPIAALVEGAIADTQTIAAVMSQPGLGDRRLSALGVGLAEYAIADLPNAAATPIQAFHNWEIQAFAEVPGLSYVPLAKMPRPLAAQSSIVARISAMTTKQLRQIKNTVSGSVQKGFRVACPDDSQVRITSPCAGIVLDDAQSADTNSKASLKGKQWVLGLVQTVDGGFGSLKNLPPAMSNVERGFEPTGRHPFGSIFKQVLEQMNEAGTSVTSSLVFRVCANNACSPYNQFKVPFISYQIDDLIVIGTDSVDPGSSDVSSISTGAEQGSYQTANSGICTGESVGGISVDTLSEAIAQMLNRAGATDIGAYTCTDKHRCGRSLGQYQSLSYAPPVQAIIRKQTGGDDWLKQLESGQVPKSEDLLKYFPPEAQTQLVRTTVKDLLQRSQDQSDPTTKTNWTGLRLIERVAQVWAGGEKAAIDGSTLLGLDGLSLKQYGLQVQKNYQAQGGSINLQCGATDTATAVRVLPNQKIAQSIALFSTEKAQSGTNEAAAWAINQVLASAGINPLGGDSPDFIPSVVADLQRRCTVVAQAQTQAGDLVVAPGLEHIGICLDAGCTKVRSAGGIRKVFGWDSTPDFDGTYEEAGKFYRLTQP